MMARRLRQFNKKTILPFFIFYKHVIEGYNSLSHFIETQIKHVFLFLLLKYRMTKFYIVSFAYT